MSSQSLKDGQNYKINKDVEDQRQQILLIINELLSDL